MRLDKFLSHMGFGSRKTVKEMLKKKEIMVNGTRIKDGKYILDEYEDQVQVQGELIGYQALYYYLLHKPKDVISATEDRDHRTVLDLLTIEDYRTDLFPVGRLDKDTTGLLVITNDGDFSHRVLSPKKHVPKTYVAEIKGIVTEEDIKAFSEGLLLSGAEECQPATLTVLATDKEQQKSQIRVVITEGKYHQVKRMFESVGKQVIELHREKMGSLTLDPLLKRGEYRILTAAELAKIEEK